jgi:hypothetical protein
MEGQGERYEYIHLYNYDKISLSHASIVDNMKSVVNVIGCLYDDIVIKSQATLYYQYYLVNNIHSDDDLYLLKNKKFLTDFVDFVKELEMWCMIDIIQTYDYEELEEVDGILFDEWLEKYYELVGQLDTILLENHKGFCKDLTKYTYHPERISRMAEKFGIEFDEYLDAIDM